MHALSGNSARPATASLTGESSTKNPAAHQPVARDSCGSNLPAIFATAIAVAPRARTAIAFKAKGAPKAQMATAHSAKYPGGRYSHVAVYGKCPLSQDRPIDW